MVIIKKTYFFQLLSLLLLCLPAAPAIAETNDCDEGFRWEAFLINDTIEGEVSYKPSEFFTPDGAVVPDITGTNINEHNRFEFRDTSCLSDKWELTVKGVATKLFYGTLTTTVGIETYGPTDDPVLNETGKPALRKRFIAVEDHQEIKPGHPGLRYAFRSTYTIRFLYQNEVLYAFTSEGGLMKWPGKICKMSDLQVWWDRKGDSGTITEVSFTDHTNGTSYYEDFSDCSAVQELPECAPEPELEIKAEFILPNCEDSTLRLKAEANFPVDFHWVGPGGFKSDAQNPVIKYEDAVSGKYMVWGRIDDCLEPYVVYLDIDVPLLKYKTEQQHNTCHGDTVWVGGKPYTQSGIYTDTLQSADGCDSIVISSLHFDLRYSEIEATDCSAKGYFFNGRYLQYSGKYSDTVKVDGCNCDSIVTLTLTKLPVDLTVHDLDLCKEDSLIADGHVFRESGVYRDTLQKASGCDSLVVFNVKMNPQLDTVLTYRICNDEPVLAPDGIYYSRDTFFTKLVAFEGIRCKVRTLFDVKATKAVHIPDTVISLCNTHSTPVRLDSFQYATYKWEPATGVKNPYSCMTNVTIDGDSSHYTLHIERGFCKDSASIAITTNGTPEIERLEYDVKGDNVVLEVSKGLAPYTFQMDSTSGEWLPVDEIGKADIGVHMVYVTDARGCTVNKLFKYFIPVIPAKYMTPNGDGIRDTWEIKNLDRYSIYTVKIFDRWGKLLVRYDNEYPGWDGTYNGTKMPSTDYWYSISVDLNEQDLAGHFSLVRK